MFVNFYSYVLEKFLQISKNSSQKIYKISMRNDDLIFFHYSNNPRVSNVF